VIIVLVGKVVSSDLTRILRVVDWALLALLALVGQYA